MGTKERLVQVVGPLMGGALIGLAASLVWLTHGRVAGVSGLLYDAVEQRSRAPLAIGFVAGMMGAGVLLRLVWPSAFGGPRVELALVALSGLLVGFGTRLGAGCTSGHGVCGISRFSKRAVVATMTFMVTGAIAVFLVARLGGRS